MFLIVEAYALVQFEIAKMLLFLICNPFYISAKTQNKAENVLKTFLSSIP